MQHFNHAREVEVTAIIPVTDVSNRIEILSVWLSDVAVDLPFEFLFILDSPSSAEALIFKEFIDSFEHLKYKILEINVKSPGLARNLGIENSESNWLCFWDSDHFPNPNAIYQEIQELKSDVNVIIGNFETLNLENPGGERGSSNDCSTEDIFIMRPGIWRFIFWRNVIEKVRFTKFKMAEDQLFLCSIDLADQTIKFSHRTFYTYVKHRNLQLTKSPEALLDLLFVQKSMIELAANQDIKNRKFTVLALIKISLTGIKLLNFGSKLKLTYNLFRFVLNPRFFIDSVLGLSTLTLKRLIN